MGFDLSPPIVSISATATRSDVPMTSRKAYAGGRSRPAVVATHTVVTSGMARWDAEKVTDDKVVFGLSMRTGLSMGSVPSQRVARPSHTSPLCMVPVTESRGSAPRPRMESTGRTPSTSPPNESTRTGTTVCRGWTMKCEASGRRPGGRAVRHTQYSSGGAARSFTHANPVSTATIDATTSWTVDDGLPNAKELLAGCSCTACGEGYWPLQYPGGWRDIHTTQSPPTKVFATGMYCSARRLSMGTTVTFTSESPQSAVVGVAWPCPHHVRVREALRVRDSVKVVVSEGDRDLVVVRVTDSEAVNEGDTDRLCVADRVMLTVGVRVGERDEVRVTDLVRVRDTVCEMDKERVTEGESVGDAVRDIV
eukprot:Sspe_Gene.27382::Locus_11785_Transcript_1_1_Confidence_1.000_Length_14822::g.27382::m.27382